MASTYEYIISLQDKISGKLQQISGTSYEAVESFNKLREKTEKLRGITGDFGNSIFSLRNKIDLLKGERDIIDPKNLSTIRQYNSEIKSLEKQVMKLENINGGRFKTWTKDAFSQLPGFATNPLVLAGTAVFAAGKMAMGWEEGMAKINATSQLPQAELDSLGKTIKKLGVNAGSDLTKVPEAYEKILSQTNDVSLSTQILDKALKASKAGFTDVDTVAAAMAQTLSIVGSKNTNAAEVIDTLFAAKRVGAGEFKDFAQYLPQLIASAQGVNVKFKEAAGMFAYFTGKGFNAANASTLLQNSFSLLGRTDVTENMKKMGVSVYDATGKVRPMVDVFKDLGDKLNLLGSDAERQAWLDKAGIKDMQAKQGFQVLIADIDKLRESIKSTSEPAGELDSAFANTRNTTQRLIESWTAIQNIAISLGGAIKAGLNVALSILNPMLNFTAFMIDSIMNGFSYWIGAVRAGNPAITMLTVALAAMGTALAINYTWSKRSVLIAGIKTAWDTVQTVSMGILTGAIWAQNAAWMANPIGWVVGLIALLVGGIVMAWNKFEGFRKFIMGMWEVIKMFGVIIKDFIIDRIKGLISGIAGLGKTIGLLFKGEFSQAWETGKQAVRDMSGLDAAKKAFESGKKTKEAWDKGVVKGAESWKKSQEAKGKTDEVSPKGIEGLSNKMFAPGTLTVAPGSPSAPADLSPSGSIADTASTINSGAKATNITISLRNLVENINVHSQEPIASISDIKEKVITAFLEVLNSANAMAFK